MRAFPLRRLAMYILVFSVLPLQAHTQQSSAPGATVAYPNDSEGLRQLLSDMLLAAKRGDLTGLRTMIRQTEIPNYQNCFSNKLGKEEGGKLAESYARSLEKDEKELQHLMVTLTRMDGEFVTQKMDDQSENYMALWKMPLDRNGTETRRIADFFFVEGKFRWYPGLWYDPFKPVKHSLVPPKVVMKVPPLYPAEARNNNLEGKVKLQVLVRPDGSVKVEKVLSGDPVLCPAATEAVRQWRYEPARFDDQPIDAHLEVEVIFAVRP